MINGLYIALLAVVIWIFLLAAFAGPIRRSKNFSLYGPALMIKTSKDRKILDWVAKRFPAIIFSRISVVIFFIWGILSLAFLIYEAYLITTIHIVSAPSLSYYLAIPGINPAIPILYGTIALFVGVVIHELMHGIVARKHNHKVTSVGALFFVVPVGAFVEPDQEEIANTDPIIRRRIFASGAGINIIIAIVCLLIVIGLMMPAAQPVHNGFYVTSVDSNSVTSQFIQPQTEIISINGGNAYSYTNLTNNSTITPGTLANVTLFDGKTVSNVSIPAGIVIDQLDQGYPAAKAGVPLGSIVYKIDSHIIYNESIFSAAIENTPVNSSLNLTVITYQSKTSFSEPQFTSYTVITASKYDYYAKYYSNQNSPAFKNQSFLGVGVSFMGVLGEQVGQIKSLAFAGSIFSDFPSGLFQTLALPFQGLSPISGHLAAMFSVPGPSWLFWGVMNTLFWLFYINFLLALLNTLPAAILDGGQFFKDTLKIASRWKILRVFKDDRNIGIVANSLTFLVIFILFYLIIAPRIL